MNIRSRFILLFVVIFIMALLCWPNFSVRTVHLFIEKTVPIELEETYILNVKEYIEKTYPNRYELEIHKTNTEELETKLRKQHEDEIATLDMSQYDSEEIDIYNETFETRLEKKLSEFVSHTYLSIEGRFIQTAFLNELARLENVEKSSLDMKTIWVETYLKSRPFKLGLDLQGGMNLVLEGDYEQLQEDLHEKYPQETIDELQKQLAETVDEERKKEIEEELEEIQNILVLEQAEKKDYMLAALETIRSRIDRTGVSEPLIRLQNEEYIEISLPGVSSPEKAKELIRSTAQVSYHLVANEGGYNETANSYFKEFKYLESELEREAFIKKVAKEINLPSEYRLLTTWGRDRTHPQNPLQAEAFVVVERIPSLTGDAISPNSFVNQLPDTGQIAIVFQLTSEGTETFAKVTTENKGRQLAIVIDDKVRSAPTINTPILNGRANISGSFTYQEAKDLALIIKEGALPIPLNIVQERTLGPLLGKEAIRNSIIAIMIGFILVILFMLVYYHVAGVIAIIALLLNFMILLALLSLLNFTLTLPGIAGILLTIGMAVDANVIIYERIRNELALGKSFFLAIDQGFKQATVTILDSNLTTLVAAVILSQFGSGPIKGFSITFFIGILSSLFTSLFVTRTLFLFLVESLHLGFFSIGIGSYKKEFFKTHQSN